MATFTRASKATYINKQGVLVEAEIDEPRFEKEGILIEGESTNLLEYSETGLWRGAVRVEGELHRGSIILKTTSEKVEINVPLVFGQVIYTFSVWLKATKGLNFQISNQSTFSESAPTEREYTQVLATGEWQREEVVYEITSDIQGNRLYPNINVPAGSEVYFTCPQIEELPFASSYIPTNGAPVTRAGDRLTIGEGSLLLRKGYTMSYVRTLVGLGTEGYMDFFGVAGISYNLHRHFPPSFRHYVDGVGIGVPTPDGTVEIVVSLTSDMVQSVYKDGQLGGSRKVDASLDGEITSADFYAYPKSGYDGVQSYHIKNFRIWNHALTAEQIATL